MTVKEQFDLNPLVSIIVPMYNAISTLEDTVNSVKGQTYTNWELVLVDDCSKDNTKELADRIANNDARIRVYQMPKNGGPGAATKMGFEKAIGGFVAFIDADDLWPAEKLQKQIDFMIRNNYDFVCSDYRWVDVAGKPLNKIIKCRTVADYKTILHMCPIGSSTVLITAEQLRKVSIPVIRKNNDYALWLEILRDGTKIYGMHEVLMDYRIISSSNSFNKRKMIKYFWEVYRKQEGFSAIKSAFLLGQYIFIKIVGIK